MRVAMPDRGGDRLLVLPDGVEQVFVIVPATALLAGHVDHVQPLHPGPQVRREAVPGRRGGREGGAPMGV